jgi:DNA helicase-2/ATP-dependent DNA helicase PcrA
VADLHSDPAQFGAWLARTLTVEHTAGGVTLSTVHRVKGREWAMVAVVGVNGGILPHRLAVGPAQIEEERRILHVAITRSSKQTVVLFDESRPSPFLSELDGTASHRPAGAGQDGEVVAAPPAKAEARPSIDAGDPVAAALKAWRAERAAADQVPAYVVMWDRHLAGIAARRPTTKRQLAACPGIGPTRLETYGEAILDVVRRALGD